MTNQWTKIPWDRLRGYATREEGEAVRQFERRYGKAPTTKVVIKDQISCVYFLGPVEDSRHDKR